MATVVVKLKESVDVDKVLNKLKNNILIPFDNVEKNNNRLLFKILDEQWEQVQTMIDNYAGGDMSEINILFD